MLFPAAPMSPELQRQLENKTDIAFTPLAMPGLSGPGTFAVIMSLSSRASGRAGVDRVVDFLGVLTGIVIVAWTSWIVLRASERLQKVMGPTGMTAMGRLMGFLMVCIGVQFLIDGLSAILSDPTFWSGLAQALRQQ